MNEARAAAKRIVEHVPRAFGATATVKFTPGARLTQNNLALEQAAVAVIREKLGPTRVTAHPPQLGAEDFSAFSRRVPGCYLFLGVRNEDRGITHALHTPSFDVDEDCIGLGVAAMTEVLLADLIDQ